MIKPFLFQRGETKPLAFMSLQLTMVPLNTPSSSFEAKLIPVAVDAIHLSSAALYLLILRHKKIILSFSARAAHDSVVDGDLNIILPVDYLSHMRWKTVSSVPIASHCRIVTFAKDCPYPVNQHILGLQL